MSNPSTRTPTTLSIPLISLRGKFPNATDGAQQSIISWAESISAYGPWSVTNKPFNAPSGDPKDYMSWAPYSWPNCNGVGNTTELTPQQIWVTCPYSIRDGQFNPDRLTVNNIGAFTNLSDAILYNALAFSFQSESSSNYSQNIAKFVDAWFLNNATGMNPNLNYAQMNRGPNGQVGTHTGVLCTDWTEALDTQMIAWTNQYINWLETNKLGTDECASLNNHGSFCFNQLTSLKLLVNDVQGSINSSNTYFKGIYQGQINSTGDQPFEATRTHPYHYRNYNLAAMITNARILKYADPTSNPWNLTTKYGATIQDALNMVMTVDPNASDEGEAIAEIYPNIAAVASTYGDPDGKYVAFLQKVFPEYAWDGDFLWDQPLAGSAGSTDATSNSTTSTTGTKDGSGALAIKALTPLTLIVTLIVGIGAVFL
ncbi:Chondroitin AC/alginate lyase [Mycena sanguinolenta]|uniref:Chondroitin AC/alginate lyase n=1 Tax=Mycena sanguinolenta TaxID=230812 RepID=A0A8H7DC92_9AGAR|nr:Chondroitin AC/alginate lyase [Mycena sanguinolenta]